MMGENRGAIAKSRVISNEQILVMIPAEELESLKLGQERIMQKLDQLQANNAMTKPVPVDYVSAKTYMSAVGIKRWKFDQLIANNLIRTIKKKRKIYVPSSEIERYFIDPCIQ